MCFVPIFGRCLKNGYMVQKRVLWPWTNKDFDGISTKKSTHACNHYLERRHGFRDFNLTSEALIRTNSVPIRTWIAPTVGFETASRGI